MGLKQKLKNLVFRLRGEHSLDQYYAAGLTAGKNFNPQSGFNLDYSHCWLITIGDDVTFGPRVQVLAHDASMHGVLGYTKIAPVSIGSKVFVGAGSIILPGVCIGNNCIIGAGSVVTGSIPPGKVYAGNPAKEICDTAVFLRKHKAKAETSPCYDESYTLRQNITDEKKRQQKLELQDGVGYVV